MAMKDPRHAELNANAAALLAQVDGKAIKEVARQLARSAALGGVSPQVLP